MIHVFYRYAMPASCEPKLHCQTVPIREAAPLLETLKPIEYRTVIIEPIKPAKREHLGGTHASPRQHDRRGHMRRLPGGRQVWVKPCRVGDAALGTVFHDYEVRE
jgi:hypothetical protein